MPNLKENLRVEQNKQNIITALFAILMLLLFAAYTNLRWTSESPAFEKAKKTADTPAYVRVSTEEFLSQEFWANARPPMFPLVLKFFDADKVKVTKFQSSFSIFSWGMLALTVAYSFKSFLRPLAFGLILVLSLESHIAGWDVVMLTESLSISLMALFLATWFWLLRGWSWEKVIVLSMVAFLWTFTRDTNGWLLLMVAGLIVFVLLFLRARKRYLVIAVIFVLIFSLNNRSANIGQRWLFPFQNVLAQRILPDQTAVTFFEDCGMPVTPELLRLAGGYANSEERAFYQDPALDTYRVWAYADGKACFMRWLLSRPLASLREPWKDFTWLLAFEDASMFFPQSYVPLLPWYVERILYPQDALVWLWVLTILAMLISVWQKAWRANPVWTVFIILTFLIYPHIFIIWHGDTLGTHRHALTVSVQFVISLWLLGLLLLEAILVRFRVRNFI